MSITRALIAAAGNGSASDAGDPYFAKVPMLMTGDGTNGDKNKTFVDTSSNNYTITASDNTYQTAFSPYGTLWSNYFDGSGDYLSATGTNIALGSGDFTAEFWVNGSYSGTKVLLDWAGAPQLYMSNASIVWYWTSARITGTLVQGGWSHVAIVRSSGVTKMYINGVANATTWSDTTNLTQQTITIGGRASDAANTLSGYISNVRLVKGTAVYTSDFTPPTEPLTAITGTSLLTCQSNRFKDSSASALTVTTYNNTRVYNASPFAPSAAYTPALLGGSTYFSGYYNYVNYPTSIAMPTTGNFTVEGWFMPLAGDRMAVILWGDGYSAGNAPLHIYFSGTTGVQVYTSSTAQTLLVTGIVRFGEWMHIAVTRSSNTGTLWFNGVSQGTFTFSTLNNTGTFQRLGTSFYGPYGEQAMYVGYMSDVRYSNVARYSSTFTPPTAPVTNDASTVMLLNMSNGDLYDQTRMHQYNTVGTAQVTTSTSKYGTGSISLPAGTSLGSYLRVQDVPYITAAKEFTYECWFYSLDNSKYQVIWCTPQSSYGGFIGLFSVNPTMGISMVWALASYSTLGGYGTGVFPTVNTWTHLAVTRDASNTWRFFINGVLTSHTRTAMIYFTGADVGPSVDFVVPISGCSIGGVEAGQNADPVGTSKCNIYDLRITNGVARYTADFTPPATAFPLL